MISFAGIRFGFQGKKCLVCNIADFYCAKAKLVIELDGSQHYTEEGKKYDAERTAFLEGYGLKIIRIANINITRNFKNVCEYIDHQVKDRLL